MRNKLRLVGSSMAQWHGHVNGVSADTIMRDWLTDAGSLTARLQARCAHFRVQKLRQGRALCLHDEFELLALPRTLQVTEREVLLRCDEVPVVYAHTIVPLSANASQWPLFASLGNRSLGSILFADPLVKRGALSYAQLTSSHPLHKRIQVQGLLERKDQRLLARRSIFQRKGASLLVTEVFLPGIRELVLTA